MRTALLCIAVFASLTAAMIYPGYETQKPDMRVGEVVFSPANEEALQSIEQFAAMHGGKIWRATRVLEIYVMSFESAVPVNEIDRLAKSDARAFEQKYNICREQVLSLARELEKSGLVRYAAPNYLYYITEHIPNDPYFRDDGDYGPDRGEDQYAQFISCSPAGWEISTGDPDVLLCIIDSGVDVDHPDLEENIWVNPGEDIDEDGEPYDMDDINFIDDDANGYVDDLFGYDFVGGNTGESSDDISEHDWNPDIHYMGNDGWGEPDPSCGDGEAASILYPADMGVPHGTHCAGIAGAVMDNEYMFAGAAGHISIVAIRVMNPEGSGASSDMAAGIEYAGIIGANVGSMSFGGLFGSVDPAIEAACEYTYNCGVTLVAASGNEGSSGVSCPAVLPTTLAVGSFTSDMTRSNFSNYGPELDVLAGGGETESGWTGEILEVIWSTFVVSVAQADTTPESPGDHSLAGEIGTSMACPHAAGLAALIESVDPAFSPDSVYAIMRNTAQDINTVGRDDETGWGIIDFGAALEAAAASVKEKSTPENLTLKVYPNPANPTAKAIVEMVEPQSGKLEIIDISGRIVNVLHRGRFSAGTSRFMLPENLNSGAYTIRLTTADISKAERFLMIK